MLRSPNSILRYNKDQVLTFEDIVDFFATPIVKNDANNFDLEIFVANDFKVFYNNNLEGGGNKFGQLYPSIIKLLYPDRISMIVWNGAADME